MTPTAYFNPFKYAHPRAKNLILNNKKPTTLWDRIRQTYSVFAGYNFKSADKAKADKTKADKAKGDKANKWYKVPPKVVNGSNQGLFNYLIGLPWIITFSLIRSSELLVAAIGLALWAGGYHLMKWIIDSKKHTPVKLLTSPLWGPLGLALILGGFALTSAGLIGYAATRLVLHSVNLLVQKVIIPVLGGLTTGALCVTGILPLVHLCMKDWRFGSVSTNNTNTSRSKLKGIHSPSNNNSSSYHHINTEIEMKDLSTNNSNNIGASESDESDDDESNVELMNGSDGSHNPNNRGQEKQPLHSSSPHTLHAVRKDTRNLTPPASSSTLRFS